MGKKYVINGKFLADNQTGGTMKALSKNQFVNNLLLITLIVNIVIPKAGFKFNDIPITIGNILFALLAAVNILSVLKGRFLLSEIIIGGVQYTGFLDF